AGGGRTHRLDRQIRPTSQRRSGRQSPRSWPGSTSRPPRHPLATLARASAARVAPARDRTRERSGRTSITQTYARRRDQIPRRSNLRQGATPGPRASADLHGRSHARQLPHDAGETASATDLSEPLQVLLELGFQLAARHGADELTDDLAALEDQEG